MRAGRRLEKVVHYIESVVAGSENVTVESPKRLRDKTTGRLREHDVVVTVRQEHHTLIIALECRERSRPVGVPQVEAFSRKCVDTSVDKGIIVSSSGFCGTAITKARALNIQCMNVDQLNDLDWFRGPKLLLGFHRQPTSVNLTVVTEPVLAEGAGPFVIEDAGGRPFPEERLRRYAIRALDRHAMEHVPGEYSRREEFAIEGLRVRLGGSDRTVPVSRFIADLTYTITSTVQPLDMGRYGDAESGSPVSEFASARFDLGGIAGRVVMARKPDRSISVGFVADGKPKRKTRAKSDSRE